MGCAGPRPGPQAQLQPLQLCPRAVKSVCGQNTRPAARARGDRPGVTLRAELNFSSSQLPGPGRRWGWGGAGAGTPRPPLVTSPPCTGRPPSWSLASPVSWAAQGQQYPGSMGGPGDPTGRKPDAQVPPLPPLSGRTASPRRRWSGDQTARHADGQRDGPRQAAIRPGAWSLPELRLGLSGQFGGAPGPGVGVTEPKRKPKPRAARGGARRGAWLIIGPAAGSGQAAHPEGTPGRREPDPKPEELARPPPASLPDGPQWRRGPRRTKH